TGCLRSSRGRKCRLTNYVSRTVTVLVRNPTVMEGACMSVVGLAARSDADARARESAEPRGTLPHGRVSVSALAGGRGLAGIVRAIVDIFFPPARIRHGCESTRNLIRRKTSIPDLLRDLADAEI